jgi:hypothetical protein
MRSARLIATPYSATQLSSIQADEQGGLLVLVCKSGALQSSRFAMASVKKKWSPTADAAVFDSM